MIYPIVKYGDPILEAPSADVTVFDAALEKLVSDMFETMYAARGVGLAAAQIGIAQRLCVIDVTTGEDPAARLVLANPVIISFEGSQTDEEGCLSLPNFRASTSRPMMATARALNLHGEEFTVPGEGLLARALCHEIDHLQGILFIQHLSKLKRDSIRRKVRKMVKAREW